MSSAGSAALSRSNTTAWSMSNLEIDITANTTTTNETVVLFNEREMTPSSNNRSSIFGHLAESSRLGTDLGHDWALIKLSEESARIMQNEPTKKDSQLIGHLPQVLPNPRENSSVLATTGYSRRLSGVIFPGSTIMRLTPRGNFKEVWTIQFDKTLGKKLLLSATMPLILTSYR